MSFLTEFKQFALKGNVIDLAVAVVIGGAFGKIVASMVDGIIMPLIGLLLGGINITDKIYQVGAAQVKWGMFLQSVIDFTIIAFVIFLVIKLIMMAQKKKEEEPPKPSAEEVLLTEIRDLLKDKK